MMTKNSHHLCGDFTDICRIVIACTELEIQMINQTPVFLAKSLFIGFILTVHYNKCTHNIDIHKMVCKVRYCLAF